MTPTSENEKGLSLIELMVTSVLATIFGLIVYSVFFMYHSASNITISFFFLQQQYENVAHQVARDVRRATYVLSSAETPASHGAGYDTVSSIVLWSAAGPFTQYAINAGNLREGGSPVEYEAGGGTVELDNDASYFVLGPQRKKVTMHFALRRTRLNTTYALSPREDLIVCRN